MTHSSKQSLKDFTRGGQTALHNLRMLMQIIRQFLILFLSILILFNLLWWYKGYGHYHYAFSLLGTEASAHIRLFLGHTQDLMDFEAPDGHVYSVFPEEVTHNTFVLGVLSQLKAFMLHGLMWGVFLGLAICMIGAWALKYFGHTQRKLNYIRGTQLVSPSLLKNRLIKSNGASDKEIAGIPLVKGSENAHFLIAGTPGTGKSVCMMEFLDTIRSKGERAIVYDRVGDFVSYYYRASKDIILNPLDERCPSWGLWEECQDPSDFDTLAAALMPLPPSHYDPFWINAARTIFSATASRLKPHERKIETLLHYLLAQDLNTLSHLLKGTEAETLVSEKIEKTALSVKTVLSTYLKSFKYLKEEESPFSIRRWLESSHDSWLFVTSQANKHESLKPLISAWLEIAGSSLMSLMPDNQRRVWMCLDELASLHRLPYLSTLLAESRKFGGCLITSIQSIAQLRDIYGPHATEAMAGLCNTRFFFRTPEPLTAEWVSKSLGECEWEEPREGFSYGANTIRDGVSLNRQRVVRPVVMPSEVMQLANLQAYLKLPGNWPITQLQFSYWKRPTVALGFSPVPKEKIVSSEITSSSDYSKKDFPLEKSSNTKQADIKGDASRKEEASQNEKTSPFQEKKISSRYEDGLLEDLS